MTSVANRGGIGQQQRQSDDERNADDPHSEPFVFNESCHSARLLAGLRNLRDCSQLFDVTLMAEEQEFPAHRVVLASCSDYFHAMFTGGLRESSEHSILLHGVSASALEQLIHFAYTSKIKITKENVVAVLAGASLVQILPIVRACETYLCSHITLHNCTELERIADLYSLSELHGQVLCFMCEQWVPFTTTPHFLTLSTDQLKNVLSSGFPVYCAEVQVVRSLLAWVNHDLPHRASCLADVLGLVRRDDLQPSDLEELLALTDAQSIMAVCPSLSSLLSEMTRGDKTDVQGVVNTRGYVETVLLVGGFYQPSQKDMSNDIMFLDPKLQKFVYYTTIPHMKQADFGLEVLDNDVYVVGGCCNEDFMDLTHPYSFRLDISTGKWTDLPPMSQDRCRFYLGALNGKLYAVGGEVDNSQPLCVCEVFDPQAFVWSPIAPLPAARSELSGTSLGGRLYVSGGTQEGLERVKNEMWRYDPDQDTWTACAPMLSPRADHTMFTYNGRIFVIGGWRKAVQDRVPVSSVDCYDADTNRWEMVQHVKTSRKYCSYTLLRGQIYVIGGGWDNRSDSSEKVREMDVLDLKTMTWLPAPVSLPPVWEHSAVSVHLPTRWLL
ncbi:kelch-like protein 26 [Babylonia areolata]|uniref:kelch-like protein 26 n=1 Tax=Babylonia areolata TaxID=304850 RepID=UPI003FCF69B8